MSDSVLVQMQRCTLYYTFDVEHLMDWSGGTQNQTKQSFTFGNSTVLHESKTAVLFLVYHNCKRLQDSRL